MAIELGKTTLQTDAETYTGIEESRHQIIYPKLKKLLIENGHRRVLDYGGGDGGFVGAYLSDDFEHRAHYDVSAKMRELARKKFASSVSIYEDVGEIPAGRFDAVTLIAVWMEFPSEDVVVNNLKVVRKALAAHGHVYAAVTHPCFREQVFSSFKTDFSNHDYLRAGPQFKVTVFDDEKEADFYDFHWNLESMSRQINAADFAINAMYEMPDVSRTSESKGSPWLILDLRRK